LIRRTISHLALCQLTILRSLTSAIEVWASC